MINLSRAVIDVVTSGTQLPPSWTDEAKVRAYLENLTPGIAKIIVQVAQAIADGKLGLIGASPDEVRSAIAEELESRGAAIDPALIESIITIILTIARLLAKR